MDDHFEPMVDLTDERRVAFEFADKWGLRLGAPFAMSNVSYVAPTTDGAVLKVPWSGDAESLHEADALTLWDGDGAVRLLRREGRVLLEERVIPGDDLSRLPDVEATAIAVDVALRLWRPAVPPFRPVTPEVAQWLDEAAATGNALVPTARRLFAEMGDQADWVVHGDFHHHNILRSGDRFIAIDPKPYVAQREYDVASFLWNPVGNPLDDLAQTERRIRAFVAAGLDEYRIRAWTVIRGTFLRPGPNTASWLRALLT